MTKDETRTYWDRECLTFDGQRSCIKLACLQGEDKIIQLISAGAPLPHILNILCAAIDRQIGNIVSIILVADEVETDLQAIVNGAWQFGLHVFWSAGVPLRDDLLLGQFEIYCCVPRTPTASELGLIQRATSLAALAIQSHNYGADCENSNRARRIHLQRVSPAAPLLN
jgi:hypothetical protein